MSETAITATHMRHHRMRHAMPVQERPEGPGRSAESVGHRAKAFLADMGAAGGRMPRNTMGIVASEIARFGCICSAESLFAARIGGEEGVEIEAPGELGVGAEVEAGAGEVAEGEAMGEGGEATVGGDGSGEGGSDSEDAVAQAGGEGDGVEGDGGDGAIAESPTGSGEGAGQGDGLDVLALGEDLSQLAEAARQVYDLTAQILETLNVDSMETALELLEGAEGGTEDA